MGLELPLVAAVMARLPDPTINLAAYSGVVFPISLVIEAPVIMLLAASTALSNDWASYRLLRSFMWVMVGLLTGLHVLVAFTPLFDPVVDHVLGVPVAIREPARWGLMIMTPWTGAIAVRRFHQGIMIRAGHSRAVVVGTMLRLTVNGTMLVAGLLWGAVSGIVVGTTAVVMGVLMEALYIGLRVRPFLVRLRETARSPSHEDASLTLRRLFAFYAPLAVTPVLTLLALPVASAAMSRMPRAVDSLAVWPILAGLSFSLRSFGLAYQEVVVALFDRPAAFRSLVTFAGVLSCSMSGIMALLAATPLGWLWFAIIGGLEDSLASLGSRALWIALLMPALSPFESLFQGLLVKKQETGKVTQAVAIYLAVTSMVLVAGTAYGRVTGLYVGIFAAAVGLSCQALWLWRCARRLLSRWPALSREQVP